MKYFLIALQFLSILPIKIKSGVREEDFGKSLAYFPIVGLLMGAILALSLLVFSPLPPLIRAALILVFSIVITGGIHLDGLADTCDGFYAGRSREKVLNIMHDSNIGAMGVMGIASILILKFACLYSMPSGSLWKALILMAVWGRYSQVLSCSLSGYARKDGKAKFFIEYATKKELVFGGMFTFTLSLFLMQFTGIIMSLLLAGLLLFAIRYVKNRIGGMTGDTIGAISEIAEVSTLFVVVLFTII